MLAAFLAGAAAYPMVEMAWRGRTHPAMALAGGAGLSAACPKAPYTDPLAALRAMGAPANAVTI